MKYNPIDEFVVRNTNLYIARKKRAGCPIGFLTRKRGYGPKGMIDERAYPKDKDK